MAAATCFMINCSWNKKLIHVHFCLSKRWNSGKLKLDGLHMGQSCYKQSECNFRKRERTENVFHLCLFFHHHNFVLNLPLEWKELDIKCHLCLSSSSLSLCERRSVMSDCLWPHGLYSPWNSPGQNTEVGSLSLLQGIFQTQGLNPGLPHGRQML